MSETNIEVNGRTGRLEEVPKTAQETIDARKRDGRGDFHSVAMTAQAIKQAINEAIEQDGSAYLTDEELESLDSIATKIARIIHRRSKDDLDSWHDIGGYAKLVENRILEGRNNTDTSEAF